MEPIRKILLNIHKTMSYITNKLLIALTVVDKKCSTLIYSYYEYNYYSRTIDNVIEMVSIKGIKIAFIKTLYVQKMAKT